MGKEGVWLMERSLQGRAKGRWVASPCTHGVGRAETKPCCHHGSLGVPLPFFGSQLQDFWEKCSSKHKYQHHRDRPGRGMTSGCSAWRSGRGGSNSNKHVAFFMGRHLRRGDSKEGDPQLTWTRMEDTRHTEAVGIRVILGGSSLPRDMWTGSW